MPDTETVKYPTMQAAFEAAKVELAPKEEPPAPESAPAPDAHDTETAKETPAEEKEAAAPQQETAEDLLSEEEYAGLKDDPKALRKALNRAATKKFQKLSAERKQIEEERQSISQYRDLIESFKTNPESTIRILAEQYKVPLQETRQQAATKAAATTAVDRLKEALGPDGEILAERLGPVFEDMAKQVAENLIRQEIGPVRQFQEQQTEAAAVAEINAELKAFESAHPDWKQFEPKMTELGKRLQPTGEMTTGEYLDSLYALATAGRTKAEATIEVVERLNKSAKAATQTKDVNPSVVQPAPPKKPTFKEAFEAAKRGERWER